MICKLLYGVFLLSTFLFAQHKTDFYLEWIEDSELKIKIEKNVSELLSEFNSAYVSKNKVKFINCNVTKDALDNVNQLWNTAPFRCPETEHIGRLLNRPDGGYEIRNIPLIGKIGTDSTFNEEGVLLLNKNGVVEDLYFGINKHKYNKLVREGHSIADFRRRQIILNFVENFRTSYNRKDIDFIKQVFSDNALIIVGRVLKQDDKSSNYLENNFEAKKVEYLRFSKNEYIERLRDKIFPMNKYIEVKYNDIEIIQHRLHKNIYGVTLNQHWFSSSYSDKGYLFLMIDFKNENNPLIHVRAWQPEQFTEPDSVISLGDFEIIN